MAPSVPVPRASSEEKVSFSSSLSLSHLGDRSVLLHSRIMVLRQGQHATMGSESSSFSDPWVISGGGRGCHFPLRVR